MPACVALIRGINVGRAKRIAMADLRSLLEGLGYTNVRTVLNSGNAIFHAPRAGVRAMAADIEAAITRECEFSAPVIVATAADLRAIVKANPLHDIADDPSRYLVAFVASPATLRKAKALLKESWAPDALSVGPKAAYLWCANGILKSGLMQAFSRVTGDAVTARNWATVSKILAALP